MEKTLAELIAETDSKYGSASSSVTSSNKVQSAEEWMAQYEKRQFDENVQRIQNKLDVIIDSVGKLQTSLDDYASKVTEPTEVTEEIPVEAPSESTVFPYQQAAVFSLAGMLVGILLSFLVFRKMVEKVKKDYESRLSEARDSLERMIKIMSEKQ